MALVLREKAVTSGHVMELSLSDELKFVMRYGDLVEYSNGRRTVCGRSSPYEFRSVEQLRYDFERDVRAAGGVLG